MKLFTNESYAYIRISLKTRCILCTIQELLLGLNEAEKMIVGDSDRSKHRESYKMVMIVQNINKFKLCWKFHYSYCFP